MTVSAHLALRDRLAGVGYVAGEPLAMALHLSLTLGRIFGHPVEGAGHFGGSRSRCGRFGLLPVEVGDPGVEFGAAPMGAGA